MISSAHVPSMNRKTNKESIHKSLAAVCKAFYAINILNKAIEPAAVFYGNIVVSLTCTPYLVAAYRPILHRELIIYTEIT